MSEGEIATDLLTPLGAYLRLREGAGGAFLLESVERGRLGRYSFVGAGSRLVSFEEAEELGEPVVGYLGYDAVCGFEPSVPLPEEGPDVPTSLFLVPDVLLRFDHARGVAELLRGTADGLDEPAPLPRGSTPRGPLEREPSREEHLRRVERAQEHIREGNVFQVVIAQRATRPTSASAVELYRALRRVNPSPYLFLLELGMAGSAGGKAAAGRPEDRAAFVGSPFALVGSSPETVVKCSGRRAELNPIAGTISPGEGDAATLLASEKERAEHTMLVDLGRNDLSRVCNPGSVRVARFMEAERYSHVTHLVSEVVGELRDGFTPFELLRACFPAGTVSGAPKVRAMQIVSELEGYRRGIYAGAVGYYLPGLETSPPKPATSGGKTAAPAAPPGTSELDTCIAIRTLWLRDGVAHLQAGGGIVADSDPAAEHEECLAKLRALEAAIDLAESEQDAAP